MSTVNNNLASNLKPHSWNQSDVKDEISIQQAIDNWLEKEPQGNSAPVVKQCILNCLNNQTSSLNLARLDIESLPDIFHREELKFIEEINLSYSSIKKLPENFNPPYLEILDLNNTGITELPEGFNPPKLLDLCLNDTGITELPEGFNPPELVILGLSNTGLTHLPEEFNPPQLRDLYLSGTGLTQLPEGFNPPKLRGLDLSETRIRQLPEGFNPPQLRGLHLSGTGLTHLPEEFNPPQLRGLDLSETRIRQLPEEFNLAQLEGLDLSRTGITELPEGLFNLPRSCEIAITLTNFSRRVQENLRARVEAEGYQGPRFICDIEDETNFIFDTEDETNNNHLELSEVLPKVFEKAEMESPQDFLEKLTQNQTEEGKTHLKTWLNRLFETASAKASQKTFFKEVILILEEAVTNESFRNNVFYRVLDEAGTTCGDRVALSVLHLGIQKDLENLEINHPKELADFLVHGVMALDLLENYATDIVPTLPLVDPLEVYLGLPVYFKQEFNIPINTEEMLYFTCSGLRQCHIDAAREKLKTALDDEDKVLSFLVEQPKWLECLKKARPEKMRQLEEAKDKRLEEEPFEKTAEILEEYNQGLKNLTKVVKRIERFSLRIKP